MLDGLVAESEKTGFEINIAKPKAMCNSTGEKKSRWEGQI